MPPSSAGFSAALKPLLLEIKLGCTDQAVEDGFGAYMTGWATEAARRTEAELARRLARMAEAFSGYAALSPADRADLCHKTCRALELYGRRYAAGGKPDRIGPDSPLQALRGVGPKRAETLAALGLRTVGDLLRHYPLRHEDRRCLPSLAGLTHRQTATVCVTVTGPGEARFRAGRQAAAVPVTDGETPATLLWFGQPYRAGQFQAGERLVVSGMAMQHRDGLSLIVAEYERLGDAGPEERLSVGGLVPIYPLTSGVTQRGLRQLIALALERCDPLPEGVAPPELAARRGLMPLPQALRTLHFPPEAEAARPARERIAYEELLLLQCALARRKREAQVVGEAAAVPAASLAETFSASLPFSPTGAQQRVIGEVAADLERSAAANRLIHGDVGSGKTVCAAFALLAAAKAGRQAALMAPTELLAEQHYRTVSDLLAPFGVSCCLLMGGLPAAAQAAARRRIATGDAPVVIGTHALFQERVEFRDLAVAVIDEQHRFGVNQRARLSSKGARSNLFVMSATPIPRTLALTAYGDFDVSVVDELPPGRTPVHTALMWGKERGRAYETLAGHVVAGRQGYVVCPLIEVTDEKARLAAAEREFHRLQSGLFAGFKLGLLHGRIDAAEREQVMARFRDGEIEILVATTVIEVGVDVPNATVMLVENAERFGLAQLHQLRGRVGRGSHQAICLLLTRARSPDVVERLQILEKTSNGFEIAEEDLRRRGPGELAGVRQSGLPDLRMADLVGDTQTLYKAREDAFELIAADPNLALPEHTALREALAACEAGPAQWAM